MKTVSKLLTRVMLVIVIAAHLCLCPKVSAQFLFDPYTPEGNDFLPGLGGGSSFSIYNGEYQIHLTYFSPIPWRSGEVRYKYEVVSFPFIPDGTILNENIIDRKMLCANSETYGYNDTNPPCEGWGWDNYNDEITGTYPISRNIMHKSEGDMGEAYFFNMSAPEIS